MINQIFQNIVRFIFLVLLQGIILNQVELFGFASPYLYVLVILLLPIEVNPIGVLGIGFLLGLSVDLFSQSWGIHTSASVFLAFVRHYTLRILAPRDGYVFGVTPNLSQMGISWFVTYAFVLTFLHHFFLFFIEAFRFEEFLFTLVRIILSTVFTFVLIILSQLLTYSKKRSQ
ncbi:MAG: hypothetical protein KDC83_09845 [Flavobacteriales bacterium]|nr:hypothetical protein [Flavobacteriales bacterium]